MKTFALYEIHIRNTKCKQKNAENFHFLFSFSFFHLFFRLLIGNVSLLFSMVIIMLNAFYVGINTHKTLSHRYKMECPKRVQIL